MIEISIIIPMYNASNFIEQCIQSVLNQIDVEKEIIVVDDGSDDDSVEVVQSFWGSQVILIKKENGGASSARNVGLRMAQGRYVMFLDSDDWIDDNLICRKCIDKLKQDHLQMCIFNYRYFNNDTHEYIETTPIKDELTKCYDVVEITTKMVSGGLFPASPCFRVIERDFLLNNDIYFIEKTTAEDIEWFTHILSRISRFGFLSDASYIYRKKISTSVTGQSSREKCVNLMNRIRDAEIHAKSIRNEQLKYAVFSALAYEYCIFLGNMNSFKKDHCLKQGAKELSCLLHYEMFPRINYIKKIYKIFGLNFLVKLMGVYIKKYAKSNS